MNLDDRNAELNKQLEHNPIDETVAALLKADNRRKRQLLLLFLSLAFEFVILIALGAGWRSNHNLAIQAETNHNAIVRNCETSNEARAKNKEIWAYLLIQTPTTAPTPEQQAFRDSFETKVNDTFAPRDCQAEINKK